MKTFLFLAGFANILVGLIPPINVLSGVNFGVGGAAIIMAIILSD